MWTHPFSAPKDGASVGTTMQSKEKETESTRIASEKYEYRPTDEQSSADVGTISNLKS